MVKETKENATKENATKEVKETAKDSPSTAGMKGRFVYVGLDIDTTGRRLIDEIVNVAAYTKNAEFSQHIMPLMNLNPGARQRHQVRVINVGCFRMLKSMQTYKVIKSKTEIAALLDFLDWLETVNTKDGIICVYHENQKFMPHMILEAMKKYLLLERFEKTVKSFVNLYAWAEEQTGASGIKYLSLCQNYKLQLEKLGMEATEPNEFEGDATVRCKLSYEIMQLMAHAGEKKEVSEEVFESVVNDFVREKARPTADEHKEIAEQEECIKRQSSMRDVFRGYFQASRYHRRRAVTYRRLLSEAQHDIDSLTKMWEEGKRDALVENIKKFEALNEEDQLELVEILDSHFDPEKKQVKPVVQRRENPVREATGREHVRASRRRRGPRGRSVNKENMGPRSNSRRKHSTEQRINDNNNNHVVPKEAMRKEQPQQAEGAAQMVAAN